MPTFTFQHEPAMGVLPHFRTRPEDGGPDQVLRLDRQVWDDLGQPVTVTVTVEAKTYT